MRLGSMRFAITSLVALLFVAPFARAGEANDALLAVARQRNTAAVIAALKNRSTDPRVAFPDGSTALHWAAHWGDAEMTKALLARGARANVANDYGVTPLALAVESGSAPVTQLLLEAKADPNLAMSSGETPLMTAARSGHSDLVTILLGHGAHVDAREALHGQTALMWAAAEGDTATARVLVEHGADVNARTATADKGQASGAVAARIRSISVVDSAFTPLLFAARNGSIELVRFLLEKGADRDVHSAEGAGLLTTATVRGHVALVRFLLDLGLDPNDAATGFTPLHWVVGAWESVTTHDYQASEGEWRALRGVPGREDQLSLARALIDHGASPNALITRVPPRFGFSLFNSGLLIGSTPLWIASQVADLEMMQLLLSRGADPALRSSNGTTALMAASGLGYVDQESTVSESAKLAAVRFLLDRGADVNAANKDGETALHAAAYEGFDSIVEALARAGATLTATNTLGHTPLTIAKGVSVRGKFYHHESTAALLERLQKGQ
jgi:uncharacterized protein